MVLKPPYRSAKLMNIHTLSNVLLPSRYQNLRLFSTTAPPDKIQVRPIRGSTDQIEEKGEASGPSYLNGGGGPSFVFEEVERYGAKDKMNGERVCRRLKYHLFPPPLLLSPHLRTPHSCPSIPPLSVDALYLSYTRTHLLGHTHTYLGQNWGAIALTY